jgi:hypothetical protein
LLRTFLAFWAFSGASENAHKIRAGCVLLLGELTPMKKLELRPVAHTPYLGVGYVYAFMALDNISASVGGTDGVMTLEREGGIGPNLEAGVRYVF